MNDPKKRGRPKKAGETKTDNLLIRLDPSEKEAFRSAAAFAGVSVASWVRERLRIAAARELESQGQQVPFFRHLLG